MMQRSEYRRLFIAQGTSPMDVLRVLGQVYPRIEYDRGCRNNVLVVVGDLNQARIQLPKDDPHIRGPLSTHNFLMMQCALTNFDFTCELELVVSLSVSLFSTGINTLLVPPSTKKVAIKVFMTTSQSGVQNTITNDGVGKASPKGYRSTPIRLGGQNSTKVGGLVDSSVIHAPPCKIPLNGMIRGVWTFLVVDMGGLICEHVKTNSGFAEMLTPSGSKSQPLNILKKSTQLHIDVMSLLLERVTICGSVRIRDITTASDEQAVFRMNKDENLPVFFLPLTDLSEPSPPPVSQQHLLHAYPQSPKKDQRLTNTTILSPPKHAISLEASPVGLQLKESIDNSGVSFVTPVKHINVRFSKDGQGMVSFVAKDPERDQRAAAKEKAKKEAELQEEEFRRKEQELLVALEQEALANRYTRLVEPVKEPQTDRFGVRMPDKQYDKGLANQIDINSTSNFEGWLDAAFESGTLCDTEGTNAQQQTKTPSSKGLIGKSVRRRPAAGVPASGSRIATPPLRFDYLTRKPTKASKRPPPQNTPAPSSLILTAIMKRPLQDVHVADDIRLVACPIEGGRQTSQNVVLSHKDVGYGKGCLAIIHSTSSDESDDEPSDDDTEE